MASGWDLFNMLDVGQYGSQLRYFCPLGQNFLDEDKVTLHAHQEMVCTWNETWVPSKDLMECVATGCMNPYMPDASTTHLISNYTVPDVELPFDSVVEYTCERGFFFDENYHMDHFLLRCTRDGTWEGTYEGKFCVRPEGNPSL